MIECDYCGCDIDNHFDPTESDDPYIIAQVHSTTFNGPLDCCHECNNCYWEDYKELYVHVDSEDCKCIECQCDWCHYEFAFYVLPTEDKRLHPSCRKHVANAALRAQVADRLTEMGLPG